MDLLYYKNFNIDLINHNEEDLVEHFNLFGKFENRIINDISFQNYYPFFIIDLYRTFNDDFKDFTDFDLKLFYHNNCKLEEKIYSLKQFYKKFSNFNYYDFKNYDCNVKQLTEIETIIYWYNNYYKNNLEYSFKINNNVKDIIIYPHTYFNLSDGGIIIQYYLANILDKYGVRVRIKKNFDIIKKNDLFNSFYDDDFDFNNTVVIYCEGIEGNPFNAKYVVRWMLSELGKNVPKDYLLTWGKDELIYYFNSEDKINKSPEKINSIYKYLSLLYINEKIENKNLSRSGYCHSFRKNFYHKNISYFHPNNSFEITRNHTQNDYLEIFNNHEFFICYDPLSFLQIISILCGCITIVYPVENKTKIDWLKNTVVWPYLKDNNLDNLYGIAYGVFDLNYAKKTIHLAKEQWYNINKYNIEKFVKPFINNIENFDKMENTIKNNF